MPPTPLSASSNLRVIGHCDQGGRPDGVQVMLHEGHAYVGHMFSDGVSVLDVRDPRAPRAVGFVACPPNTRSHHIQVHDGIMLATNSANIWAMQRYADQADYFTAPLDDSFTRRERDFTAGLRVFDLADPAAPREIGFCAVEGIGLHRIWWVGGRYAYASCHFDGFTDHVLAIFDVADPTHPHLAGRWALPGMERARGEAPLAPGKRWALHHMIVAGDRGYAAWRDGGVTIHDLSQPAAPALLSHRLFSPPFAGGAHTPLPLPGRGLLLLADEATTANCANGLAHTWVMDVREPGNPVPFATLPQPAEAENCARGGKFGPHNLHENRPGTLQSETLVFATWHNAGVRVFDLANPFQPREVAHCVPAAPTRLVDIRPGASLVTQSCDVLATTDGLLFVTDTNAGLSVLEFAGGMTATISGRVYARLRGEIVSADLPPGGKLRIEALCARYGVTSTPVREALNQLASEGFVLRREQRGFQVAAAHPDELRQLTQTRCWVEPIALREAIAHRTPGWEARLHDSWRALSHTPRSGDRQRFVENPAWEAVHREFHMALIATCPSHWLIAFCGQLSDHATRYRRLAMSTAFPHRSIADEHRTILDAALAGDTEAAVAALVAHYRRTADIVLERGIPATAHAED